MKKPSKFDIGKSDIRIIQGGMGIGVFRHAAVRGVSMLGALGNASGIGLEHMMARELQMGDPNGDIRWALEQFPNQDVAARISDDYFIKGGKASGDAFKSLPFPGFVQAGNDPYVIKIRDPRLEELLLVSNFAEVALAKRGHDNPVGINYLHKVQGPLLPYLAGAVLAGVDVVSIGAGIPKEIPGVLDDFCEGRGTVAPIAVTSNNPFRISFDPTDLAGDYRKLDRPAFLGIVSNHIGVKALPNVDGYIIEGYTAAGHNAPARSKGFNENGEPAYGPKDEMNFEMLRGMLEKRVENGGKRQPYFLAGGYTGRLQEAEELGAKGIQIGSLAEFSRESSVRPGLRKRGLDIIMAREEGGAVYTDPRFSPSGFPFKVLQVDGTLSSKGVMNSRKAVCGFGYLAELYEKPGGDVGMRCPAEPGSSYLRKGGKIADRDGRACLCTGLLSNVSMVNLREPVILTAGSETEDIKEVVGRAGMHYKMKDVVDYVLRNADE